MSICESCGTKLGESTVTYAVETGSEWQETQEAVEQGNGWLSFTLPNGTTGLTRQWRRVEAA